MSSLAWPTLKAAKTSETLWEVGGLLPPSPSSEPFAASCKAFSQRMFPEPRAQLYSSSHSYHSSSPIFGAFSSGLVSCGHQLAVVIAVTTEFIDSDRFASSSEASKSSSAVWSCENRYWPNLHVNQKRFSLSLYIYIRLSIYLSIYLSTYLSIYLSIYLSTYLPIYLSSIYLASY